MKKKLLRILAVVVIAFSSCTQDDSKFEEITVSPEQKNPLTSQQIVSKIDESLQTKGSFNWKDASNHEIWSALENGNNICTIGFGDSKNDFDRSKSISGKGYQNTIIQIIERYEGKSSKDFLISSDPFLNLIDVIIEKQETVIALRKNNFIRYVEPSDFRYFQNKGMVYQKSSSGCGLSSETISSSDYTTIAPNAKLPWAFNNHNIPAAWNYSTGAGVTIGVVDTGASTVNSLLNSSFNSGYSSGRSVQRYGVYVDSVWPWSTGTDGVNDKCGHGTSMSSVATAPRNNAGQPVGVAYNANLIAYRAASNVVLDGYHEQNGVKNAFTGLANNSSVKIISMSMGHIFSVGKIEDGVKYAYGKGKLIFCAGGTSTSFTNFVGVIFPAWMAETVAVTGIKEASTYQKCDVCHTGSKIDFTIMMERPSGSTIPVNSYYDGQGNYVGGSSVATATTAGIAALVWAKNPSWTRDQVLNKMKQTSHLYPNKHSEFGYGMPNALLAVQ
ncbi:MULTISPECIES: S8 family peptidase [Flavobacterium]|uniref:Peptidase S8/S53 domain-containing protein n=1 Tax=Flavobacterium hankyongi TaxID=1176532 RepID=A0ABP8ZXV8_9FLAO|nr:S8/S53 family peptidase [Flavobacterium sp. N1846]